MTEHQALLWLPEALRAAGLPFGELTGWESNQPGYYWTDETGRHHGYRGDPNGWVWHHTATRAYTPVVKNSAGQTKANIYIGIWRNNRLWSFGNGRPLIMLASGGPANYSNGAGRLDVLTDNVVQDRRFHGPQASPDTPGFYGNRYYGATEVIHPGDGSVLHPDVWELQVQLAVLMSEHWGWSAWRHIGHLDHTRRKIDQRFQQGAPYTISQMQDEVKASLEEEKEDMDYRKMLDLWGPGGLEKLRVAGRWSGETAYYFDGRSDSVEGANQNLVEHIMVNDALLSVDEAGGGDLNRGDTVTLT